MKNIITAFSAVLFMTSCEMPERPVLQQAVEESLTVFSKEYSKMHTEQFEFEITTPGLMQEVMSADSSYGMHKFSVRLPENDTAVLFIENTKGNLVVSTRFGDKGGSTFNYYRMDTAAYYWNELGSKGKTCKDFHSEVRLFIKMYNEQNMPQMGGTVE